MKHITEKPSKEKHSIYFFQFLSNLILACFIFVKYASISKLENVVVLRGFHLVFFFDSQQNLWKGKVKTKDYLNCWQSEATRFPEL